MRFACFEPPSPPGFSNGRFAPVGKGFSPTFPLRQGWGTQEPPCRVLAKLVSSPKVHPFFLEALFASLKGTPLFTV